MIPKGRAFGSWGEREASNITEDFMINECGLENVSQLRLEPIPDWEWEITTLIESERFELEIIDDQGLSYPYENPIPISEIFHVPVGKEHWNISLTLEEGLNYNYSFNNDFLVPTIVISNYPCSGSYTNYTYVLNITGNVLQNNGTILGNATYLKNSSNIPDDQDWRLFILDDVPGAQDILDNISSASGCVIITEDGKALQNLNISKCNYSVVEIENNSQNQENISLIKSYLEDKNWMFADNYLNNGTISFT